MADPADWLVANVDLLRPGGAVLDVACGSGRHAIYLAERGFRVHAIDRDPVPLEALRRRRGITTDVIDLERGPVSLDPGAYDAVVVFNYLHRPLMSSLVAAVAPGGVLLYETFTTAQAARGRPTNPAFLLKPGELPLLVAPLSVVRSREGEFDGKFVASVVAMR